MTFSGNDMAKSLSDRISEARGQGYKDDEIVKFLVQSGIRADDITAAIKEGYSSTQSLDYLTAGRPIEERASRIPGLIARGAAPVAVGAAMGAPFGPPGMAAGAIAVPAAEAATQLYNLAVPQSMQIATPMQAINQIASRLGLPQPETVPEQMITAAGGGTAGAIGTIPGMARLAQTAVTPTGRAIAGQMAARPGQQVVAGAVGPATGEAVADVADSDVAGVLASIVASGAVGAGRGQREIAPTRAAVRAESQNAYQRATNAGVVVTPQSLQNAVSDIEQKVIGAGYDPGLHPKVSAVLARLQKEGQQPRTLDELEILRRVAAGAAASNERDERRIGKLIVSQIDDYVNNISPTDLISGNRAGINELRDARKLWSMNAKAEVFEQMINRAETTGSSVYTQSGYENALRGEFRRLANNPNRMRQFTQAEQDQITEIARGGTLQNMLRLVGKFSPTSVISAPLSAGTGYVVGGPIGAAVIPAVGLAARSGSQRMMQQQVNNLIDEILAGRPIGREPATYFNAPAAMRGLLNPQVEVE